MADRSRRNTKPPGWMANDTFIHGETYEIDQNIDRFPHHIPHPPKYQRNIGLCGDLYDQHIGRTNEEHITHTNEEGQSITLTNLDFGIHGVNTRYQVDDDPCSSSGREPMDNFSSRTSVNSALSRPPVNSALARPSENTALARPSENSVLARTSVNTALAGPSVNTALARPSVNTALSRPSVNSRPSESQSAPPKTASSETRTDREMMEIILENQRIILNNQAKVMESLRRIEDQSDSTIRRMKSQCATKEELKTSIKNGSYQPLPAFKNPREDLRVYNKLAAEDNPALQFDMARYDTFAQYMRKLAPLEVWQGSVNSSQEFYELTPALIILMEEHFGKLSKGIREQVSDFFGRLTDRINTKLKRRMEAEKRQSGSNGLDSEKSKTDPEMKKKMKKKDSYP